MIEIKPNAFYTVQELEEMFAQLDATWHTLRQRLVIRKVHGLLFWGQHIIEAINEQGVAEQYLPPRGNLKGRV